MTTLYSLAEVKELFRPEEGPTGALPAHADVVIVGAGPIGLTLANLLGGQGIETLVLEQNRATADLPRAIIVDDEYMRALDRAGLTEALRGHLTEPVGVQFFSRLGFILARLEGGITPNGFGGRCAMGQPKFEKLLLAGAKRFGHVMLRFGCQALDIKQTEERAELTVKDHQGREAKISARYVLACDGAHSLIRKKLGIPFEGRAIDQPHLVVDFAEFPDQSTLARFICDPARPLISVPAPYGGRRIEFMLQPGDDPKTITSEESIKKLVAKHTPYPADNLKIVRAVVYGFSERIAPRLREGRVFLLGDAAHIMPPFGGQGMNAGGRDAANLAWKIAAVLKGEAKDFILDSYDAERRENIEVVVGHAVREGNLTNIRSRPLALLRDLAFAFGNLFPSFRRYFKELKFLPRPFYHTGLVIHSKGAPTPLVGRMVPRPDLKGASFDGAIGMGYALVGVGVAPEDLAKAAHHPLWTKLKPVCIAIAPGDTAPPPAEGVTSAAFGIPGPPKFMLLAHVGQILIVRPDRYVAASAPVASFASVSNAYAGLLGLTHFAAEKKERISTPA